MYQPGSAEIHEKDTHYILVAKFHVCYFVLFFVLIGIDNMMKQWLWMMSKVVQGTRAALGKHTLWKGGGFMGNRVGISFFLV